MANKAVIHVEVYGDSVKIWSEGEGRALRAALAIQYAHECVIGAKSIMVDGKALERLPDEAMDEALSEEC
ncbi:TPA: hypothetical protein L4583_005082 [Pseudomonas aeruginosa]|nr:hypothetical protein [Pseudomonas aeruginosa]HBO6118127.1 hypothetical protein [Pseudomonas aeruginosa]HBO6772060.1 hypothetical protein [Pseudomonas aeruginosa]